MTYERRGNLTVERYPIGRCPGDEHYEIKCACGRIRAQGRVPSGEVDAIIGRLAGLCDCAAVVAACEAAR